MKAISRHQLTFLEETDLKQTAEAIIGQNSKIQWIAFVRPYWLASLAIWLVMMCIVPDSRPLSAPDWSIRAVQSVIGPSERKARFIAAVALRTIGVAMIGVLAAMSLQGISMRGIALVVLAATPLLAIGVKWISFGYFPIREQLFFIIVVAVLGGLVGLSICRSRLAAIALVCLSGLLFGWGTSTRVPDDLKLAARVTGNYLLESANEISSGDEAFGQLLRMAFDYARENSHGSDAIFPNKAAILALGVIMGDDQVVRVGGGEIDPSKQADRDSLRQKVTAHGRSDLPRHFAVSAALTVLADQHRSLAVGIAKEVSDSKPGGSGFSFVDMVANKSGIRLAVLATNDTESALLMQTRIAESKGQIQFIPEIGNLPEGLSSETFESLYGGLGGKKTRELMAEIDRRVDLIYAVR